MPMDLPEDVWLDIVENHLAEDFEGCWSQRFDWPGWRHSVSNLALTNKRLHQIATPALYHTLSLRLEDPGSQPYVALANLIRIHRRARALYHSDHLLRHVREFNVHSYALFAIGNALRNDTDLHHFVDACGLWLEPYDAFASLVLKMPGLRALRFFHSPITPRFHRSICRIPLLASLMLHPRADTGGMWQNPVEQLVGLHIRHLEYQADGTPCADAYFANILGHCIPYLTKLNIEPSQLSQFAVSASNRCLSLQTLIISFRARALDPGSTSALSDIFFCSPELRVLELRAKLTEFHLLDLGPHVLSKLESVTGEAALVRILAPGRPLKQVEVLDFAVSSLGDIFSRSSATQIQRLKVRGVWESFQMLIKFLHPPYPFEALTHLRIGAYYQHKLAEKLRIEELRITLGDALRQWPRLRVVSFQSSRLKEMAATGFPIAEERNPSNRGHPSLEEFMIMSHRVWFWVHGQGWTGRELTKAEKSEMLV